MKWLRWWWICGGRLWCHQALAARTPFQTWSHTCSKTGVGDLACSEREFAGDAGLSGCVTSRRRRRRLPRPPPSAAASASSPASPAGIREGWESNLREAHASALGEFSLLSHAKIPREATAASGGGSWPGQRRRGRLWERGGSGRRRRGGGLLAALAKPTAHLQKYS
jgi:hypothetical protein